MARKAKEPQIEKKRIRRFVLTGGPCAGKTSGLAYLYKRLESLGFRPFVVPETATITILGGAVPGTVQHAAFQVGLIRLQFSLEEHFEALAESCDDGREPVLICDRGAMDGKAFCSEEVWAETLETLGMSEVELRDLRYEAVFHMVTAAVGAPKFYTTENNAARTETIAQASVADRRLQAAWLGHYNRLRVIDNSTDFETKIRRVGDGLCDLLEVPASAAEKLKFALPRQAGMRLKQSGLETAKIEIVQTYLVSMPTGSRRVRKRTQGGSSAYFYASERTGPGGQSVRDERLITHREYVHLLREAAPAMMTVKKTRYCYLYCGCHHELDVFSSPKTGFCILEVPADNLTSLPIFLVDAKDVSGDAQYDNASIARRQ